MILIDADACPVIKEIEWIAKKARRAKSRNHLKGPAKRTEEDNKRFEEAFEKLILQNDIDF